MIYNAFFASKGMPCKFKKYLPKGYSWKISKQTQDEPEDQYEVVTADYGSQTDNVGSTSVETQTEIVVDMKSVATQTDEETDRMFVSDVEKQTDGNRHDNFCISNNDEKFSPLVAKHDGVFKDVSGKFA